MEISWFWAASEAEVRACLSLREKKSEICFWADFMSSMALFSRLDERMRYETVPMVKTKRKMAEVRKRIMRPRRVLLVPIMFPLEWKNQLKELIYYNTERGKTLDKATEIAASFW
ncbi:MAG: hypothetical protein BWY86_00875 [Candidatus Aminicenantes bacterium ADurb.Bin508]|nr:MAG: hypothetical protein BWY86_00875 [Candidatus Aminicenantes bacterium ADurb.Bin508]